MVARHLAVLAAIALPVLAFFELHHSGEANTLRAEANRLRAEANDLQDQIGSLTAELAAERNKHLQQIAKNTQKPVTQAERNAETLRQYLGANVPVSEGKGVWGTTPQIVDVNDNNVATLFSPYSPSSSIAWCVQVHCDDLEITEIPQGSCPLRLRVLKRYGADVQLGQITKWEDRRLPAATPIFAKGGTPYYATFSKQGSGETRSLYVYASADGANSFLLEASTGERVVADNVEISKRFMLLEVEYCAAGFNRNGSGSGGGTHQLFIR